MAETVSLRIALAQVNPIVGDLEGNVRLAREWIARARDADAQIVLFPELAIPGYPPEDLLLRRDFLEANAQAVRELATDARDIVVLAGYAEPREPHRGERDAAALLAPGGPLCFNALAVLAGGELQGSYRKIHLPNYGVFDERRYFESGTSPAVVSVDGALIGLSVCEDLWVAGDPEASEAAAGAHLVVNASASPYHRGKGALREDLFAQRALEAGALVAMCNTVGGQDELVFDGASVVVDRDGTALARAPQFKEDLLVAQLELPVERGTTADAGADLVATVNTGVTAPAAGKGAQRAPLAERLPPEAEVYEALCLGLRDYVRKNGFEHVVLALSGGIDSALVALVAADALGPERVTCVVMPSPHSSEETQADARQIAANLGCELIEIPIAEAMDAYGDALGASFGDGEPGLAEENIQARIRGNLVMALSNRFGWLVLTTGNKSEMSVGYATLYGDMAGGFAVLKDVPKTLVYELVRYRNEREGRELVPSSVLERAPSAELRPDQKDSDSLPPYDVLDRILEAYVERDEGPEEIAAEGLPREIVERVVRMVDHAEYKRRQAPPGIKITPKAFGRDRRLPITNRYAEAWRQALPR